MPSYMLSSDRIVGGVDAPTPIPWQVSVRSGTFHFCRATIIDASTLLGAAHCFYHSPTASGKSVRAGSTQKSSGGQVCFDVLEMLGMHMKTLYYLFLGQKHFLYHLEYKCWRNLQFRYIG